MACNNVGKGKIYFLGTPIEKTASSLKNIFVNAKDQKLHKIYEMIGNEAVKSRLVAKTHPFLGITEHRVDSDNYYIVIVNYSPDEIIDELSIKPNWQINSVWNGSAPQEGKVTIGANNGIVLKMERTG